MCSVATPERLSLCIVIPVCNEAESISLLRDRLATLQSHVEERFRVHYLFVDDGSTDQTPGLLRGAVPVGATFQSCTHAVNRGVGAAFRTGFTSVDSDIVCTIDADCSYAPEHLSEMIATIERDEADVVVASPYHPNGGVSGVQRWRLLLSTGCSACYRFVTPLKLFTYTSIFRAYRGSIVREVVFPSHDFVAAVEILLSASKLGYRIAEFPLMLHRRAAGVSKMRVTHTIRGHLGLIIGCLFARNGGYPHFCGSKGASSVNGRYAATTYRQGRTQAEQTSSTISEKKAPAIL